MNGIAFTRQGRCQEREEVLGTTKPPYTLALMATLLRDEGCDVRLVDLPSSGDWPWRDLFALAPDPHGNAWAWRDRRWYRQQLVAYRSAAEAAAPYRPGGVYVVIGGAGLHIAHMLWGGLLMVIALVILGAIVLICGLLYWRFKKAGWL